MQPLNPFLRAFFRSTLPGQCSPAQHHVLLVPTTDTLLNARDRESHALYADLSGSEEFLASHVLRVPGGIPPGANGKDTSFRESRGKAKQYTTANGRTVIIKDTFVYSNKGFKSLNQAQLMHDIIYYPDSFDAQPWLVYYISRPLIGVYESLPIIPALPDAPSKPLPAEPANGTSSNTSSMPRKREVKSFAELLNMFPMIARQMQPGLERLFKEFGKEFEKPLPPVPSSKPASVSSRRSSISSGVSLPLSLHSSLSNGSAKMPSTLEIYDEEDMMRRSLETAVTAAIDLFQMVDKQQLSNLGATTDLTGPIVERMIERYVCEQSHETILFPRICTVRRFDDLELESRVRQMQDLDISQVGIPIENGQQGKLELAARLAKGVEIFKKMGTAGSPQEMLDILLATQKLVTMPEPAKEPSSRAGASSDSQSEKQDAMLTINADTLVSLLLVVVIRSSVRHLQARLSYMRHFIFIDDVESGEMGYALSTFEAVLTYLARDSHGLRKASKRNKQLWQAAKNGDIAGIRNILEPGTKATEDGTMDEEPENAVDDVVPHVDSAWSELQNNSLHGRSVDDWMGSGGGAVQPADQTPNGTSSGSLAHVFPFQRAQTPPPEQRPKIKKRVSMQPRSSSSSSAISFASRSDTVISTGSGLEGDTSIEKVARTQDRTGQSVLMMAIEKGQEKSLKYLLSLEEFYPFEEVISDCNNDGTTLLSAAIQQTNTGVVNLLLEYFARHVRSEYALAEYIAQQDSQGRCAGHYLFDQPLLIPRIGHLVPWKLKDKNGQTPLFALCRSYDHQEYRSMVEAAVAAATRAQHDGQPLHLDDHIDSKGNTLLHIVNDPHLALKLLYHCDADANAANDKQFTPLMVASKYGRTDLVRVLFGDPRVDLNVKDTRGLTAVELAKDDEVRNRIDDLVLLSSPAGADGRTTTVVRSYFVEDGTIRMVLKSGAPNGSNSITVTTCRRSLADFENLAKWLSQENPASWIPAVTGFATPFLIPSKPSRAILRDIQLRLDSFLKILLQHPTFSTHEMVWEFFLVPDMDQEMLAERSKRKAENRVEQVKEEYTPLLDVREVELFVQHARESVRGMHHSAKSVLRRTNKVRAAAGDLIDATSICSAALSSLAYLPDSHKTAFDRYVKTLTQMESSPLTGFYYNMHAISSTIQAILAALSRPGTIVGAMGQTQKQIDRHTLSLQRSGRWPLGLLDDTRHRMQREAAERVDRSVMELEGLGKELKYTQQTVAAELAAWQDARVRQGRKACRELASRMVVVEKARLESMRRAIRGLGFSERRRMSAVEGLKRAANGVMRDPEDLEDL
ncbi:vps9 domain-containing protein [Diplodia corticola]|uniref:Vps9 domain-containing protein n=1 Tax=Diplodia corticola TaxID=236234 RepID=A0A1J9SG46_9PEZI|nr:vps9 domain-containing protein [Diplodia corticola]OJD38780.1 vps9 domain-containing protein [Diplodia corticola]